MLKSLAASFSARSVSTVKSSGDAATDLTLWEATMAEVKAGFVQGPFGRSEVPADAIISPRFGLLQKSKIRPIDNYTVSGVNCAVGLQEKLRVDTMDEFAAVVKSWVQKEGGAVSLVGKTFDLQKAYRQLGVNQSHLCFSWISVWSPIESRPKFFRMESLPFGATGSVSSFLRTSAAVKTIGAGLASLVWTAFFDDFICVCKQEDSCATDMAVRHLFQSLGWSVPVDKDKPFSQEFAALGVWFDLSETGMGRFKISNTESRRTELTERIDAVLGQDSLSVPESASLRSRLLFAEAQIFGRVAKQALASVGSPSLLGRSLQPLNDEVIFHLKWLRDRVLNGKPREVSLSEAPTWYLFTDGACSALVVAGQARPLGRCSSGRLGKVLHALAKCFLKK